MDRIGNQLLNESKIALEKAGPIGGNGERFRRRDLLTLLMKANMSPQVPEHQRMSEKDVLAREYLFVSSSFCQGLMDGITCIRGSDVPCRWT
jgi:hypothetical protein